MLKCDYLKGKDNCIPRCQVNYNFDTLECVKNGGKLYIYFVLRNLRSTETENEPSILCKQEIMQ